MEPTPVSASKRAKGEVFCEPTVLPEVDRDQVQRISVLARLAGLALGPFLS